MSWLHSLLDLALPLIRSVFMSCDTSEIVQAGASGGRQTELCISVCVCVCVRVWIFLSICVCVCVCWLMSAHPGRGCVMEA